VLNCKKKYTKKDIVDQSQKETIYIEKKKDKKKGEFNTTFCYNFICGLLISTGNQSLS